MYSPPTKLDVAGVWGSIKSLKPQLKHNVEHLWMDNKLMSDTLEDIQESLISASWAGQLSVIYSLKSVEEQLSDEGYKRFTAFLVYYLEQAGFWCWLGQRADETDTNAPQTELKIQFDSYS